MSVQHSERIPRKQRVQQRDVAARAGVSESTVSRVLHNVSGISDAVRRQVLAAAGDLGYWAAAPLPTALRHIGLFVPLVQGLPVLDSYHDSILAGVEAECRRQGVHFSYTVLEDASRHEAAVFDAVRRNGIDGVLLLAVDDRALIGAVHAARLPVVLVNADPPELDVDRFLPDNRGGATRAVRHLIAYGHRRILHVTRLWRATFEQRLAAYQDALAAAGIPADPSLVLDLPSLDAHVAREHLRARLTAAPTGCTAIFCASDLIAIGAMRAAREANLRVPDDLSVIGYDDLPMAAFTEPPLTTVRIERTALGGLAVRRLIERALDPQVVPMRVELATRLIERQSVAPPRRDGG